MILVLGKARNLRALNLECRGLESPEWCVVLPKKSLQAFQNMDHFQQIFNHLWSVCATILFVLHSMHHPESLLNHPNCFYRGMFKLNSKFDAYSLLSSLSHSDCDNQTVHTLSQRSLPSPLTSTVTSSLFTHVNSNSFSLAARLHQCRANHSCLLRTSVLFPNRPWIWW